MSFLKKLFGRDDDREEKKAPPRRRREPPTSGPQEQAAGSPDFSDMPAKEAARHLGSGDRQIRVGAAQRLKALEDRTSMRPLMTSYLNFGDPEVLDALRDYADRLTPAALRDAEDVSTVGERRVRVLDMLVVTGDEDTLPTIRESTGDRDTNVHIRACTAIVELGDPQGVDLLAHDLTLTDANLRFRALQELQDIDHPMARKAVESHLERYLAEAGAIPESIEVYAPRMTRPEASLTDLLIEHLQESHHSLTVVSGSEAIGMATNHRERLEEGLSEQVLRLIPRRMAPEEQIAELEAARDSAAQEPGTQHVVLGALPAPRDRTPLPHFLTRPTDKEYTAKIVIVDPHEVRVVMEWWRYADEKAEVPTDFEVILAISRPERSAISEEEYQIFELLPEDQHARFNRAFLAHI